MGNLRNGLEKTPKVNMDPKKRNEIFIRKLEDRFRNGMHIGQRAETNVNH